MFSLFCFDFFFCFALSMCFSVAALNDSLIVCWLPWVTWVVVLESVAPSWLPLGSSFFYPGRWASSKCHLCHLGGPVLNMLLSAPMCSATALSTSLLEKKPGWARRFWDSCAMMLMFLRPPLGFNPEVAFSKAWPLSRSWCASISEVFLLGRAEVVGRKCLGSPVSHGLAPPV